MDRHITHAASISLYIRAWLFVFQHGDWVQGGSVASETGIESLVEGLGLISPQLC